MASFHLKSLDPKFGTRPYEHITYITSIPAATRPAPAAPGGCRRSTRAGSPQGPPGMDAQTGL
eukprot:10757109-Heterocapsa_arctica.AAC.1